VPEPNNSAINNSAHWVRTTREWKVALTKVLANAEIQQEKEQPRLASLATEEPDALVLLGFLLLQHDHSNNRWSPRHSPEQHSCAHDRRSTSARNCPLVCLALTFAGSAALGQSTTGDAPGQRWWSHIQFLANDSLEGRDTGSRGFEKASDYMAEQFRAAGQASGTRKRSLL
jgi:hypothetical protein